VALIVLGVGYRVALYGHPQILSLDEAMLALNVARRSWAGLLTPLAFQQTAPVLYLWFTKLALLAGGVTERALRAVPFIAGLALIPLVWLATRDLVSRPTAWVAAALAALFPLGVAYGTIAKPYTIDAAVTALLLVLAMSNAPGWWLVASIITPFLSTPSVFVNASCLLAKRRDVRAHPQIAIGWVAAVASNFFLFQHRSADAPYLQHFWAQSFPHLPLGASLQLVQLRAGFLMQDLFTGYSVAYPRAWHWVLLVVVLAGVTHIARRRGPWAAVMLAGPIVAVGLAAAVHLYPLADRTLLFTAPWPARSTLSPPLVAPRHWPSRRSSSSSPTPSTSWPAASRQAMPACEATWLPSGTAPNSARLSMCSPSTSPAGRSTRPTGSTPTRPASTGS
jgi:Dolichyl-phosphate-mannose-protein mannosyltransferase